MSWSPEDDADWRPNRVPSGLCACEDCNRVPVYEEDPTPQEQWEVTMPRDLL